jgi:hypothetical protein
METKLKTGSVILVHGWIMTKGLEGGQRYRVQSIPDHHGIATYQFTKARGKNVVARHYVGDIDVWIRTKDHPDLNRIEILDANPQVK